jgi:LuxR family maltose regulon positive regulatory protein
MQGMVMRGLAHLANGDLVEANETLSDFTAYLEATRHISDATEMVFIIGDIRITLGQLHAALQIYENAFRFLARHGHTAVLGLEDLYRGVADVHLAWYQLSLAEENIHAAEETGEHGITRPNWLSRFYVTQAQLKIAQGDLETALDLLDEAERQTTPLPVLIKQPIPAMRANVWIRQGKLDSAQRWAHEQGLSVDGDITYLQEYDYLVLARLQLARYRTQPSDNLRTSTYDLLARLQRSASAGKRTSHTIESLILEALLYDAQHEPTLAIQSLHQALELAAPEGHVRPFVDEGQAIIDLLRDAVTQQIKTNYIRRLLAAFDNRTALHPEAQSLVDPLSDRELDVLRLLHTDLSGPEIARELFISLSTMRTHTRNIYGKLGVNNRRAAVRRATELTLI